MSLRKLIITSGLAFMVAAAVPAKASADWLFTPFIGMNFGGGFSDDFGDFEDEFENRGTYGASLAWVGGGALGFELDFGFSPNFFENTAGDADFDYGENNVTTLMANVVLGAPGGGIRPYASGGVGIIRSRIDGADDFFDVSSSDWGFNLGAGITGFFTDRLGLRGDVRYFRSLQEDEDDDDFDVSLGSFKFWRGTVGLTFRF
jgi:opacity protein-like surface antigen